MTDAYEYPEQHAVLLLPGWKSSTGKLHIRRDCLAVIHHSQHMTPLLVRFDDCDEVSRVLDRYELCGWCFPPSVPDSTRRR